MAVGFVQDYLACKVSQPCSPVTRTSQHHDFFVAVIPQRSFCHERGCVDLQARFASSLGALHNPPRFLGSSVTPGVPVQLRG